MKYSGILIRIHFVSAENPYNIPQLFSSYFIFGFFSDEIRATSLAQNYEPCLPLRLFINLKFFPSTYPL